MEFMMLIGMMQRLLSNWYSGLASDISLRACADGRAVTDPMPRKTERMG